MKFVSLRIITGDIERLVGFYERATGARNLQSAACSVTCQSDWHGSRPPVWRRIEIPSATG